MATYCNLYTYLTYCNEHVIYVRLFWELRGFSPNLTLCDIPRISPNISCIRTGRLIDSVLLVWLQVKVKAEIIFVS
jgi:hypothetical protein